LALLAVFCKLKTNLKHHVGELLVMQAQTFRWISRRPLLSRDKIY